jgi:opacity protein-like surface antigen
MMKKSIYYKTRFMKKTTFLILFSLGSFINAVAQDSTQVNEDVAVKKIKFAKNTFQASSLINMNTVEMLPKGNLQFMVAHHFGVIWNKDASGGQNLAQVLGINSGIAHTYLSFDYSVTNYANIGVALTGNSKFEGWVKFRILRQQTGLRNIPVSISWVSLVNVDAQENPTDTSKTKLAWNKFSYMHQLLIARKFSRKISLQLMPTFIHYNIVPYGINNSNNIFSLGLGAKYQIKDNKALTFEYARQFNMFKNVIDHNGNITNYEPNLLAIGIEFNTGGHIFQFYIGNTTSASNIEQLTKNTNFLKDGKFAFGFRLNRGFFLGAK